MWGTEKIAQKTRVLKMRKAYGENSNYIHNKCIGLKHKKYIYIIIYIQ